MLSHTLGNNTVGSSVRVVGEGNMGISSGVFSHSQIVPVGVTSVVLRLDVVADVVLSRVEVLVADGVSLHVSTAVPVFVLQTQNGFALDLFLGKPHFAPDVVGDSGSEPSHASETAREAGGDVHGGGEVKKLM